AVSQQDPSRISGGLQDNGSVRSWAGWDNYLGGDGLKNLIDPTNHQKVYACSQDGACSRSTDGGNTMTPLRGMTSQRQAWLTPMEFDPRNPQIVYYGGNILNRSTDSGATFKAISKDLSKGGQGGDSRWGTISAIAAARTDGKVIYVGTNDGNLWVTRDTGATWSQINKGLPNRWITAVAVDPADANRAYVTVSGYRNGESKAHVFRTTDGGRTWADISGNLPDTPVNDLVIDPVDRTRLHVATDVGVFSGGGAAWEPSGTGLPQVPVTDLATNVTGGRTVLTAGTFGLGVWRLTR
ncbi:MAG TPA: glycosyl hydrolase, partial [Pilimelia sp.]|nr:glycosyl hydrolase [Pilimelia sp.]